MIPNSIESEINTNENTTWTDEKVNKLIDDITEDFKAEKNKAIDKGIKKATIPLLVKNYKLEKELEFYKTNWDPIVKSIQVKEKENKFLKNIIYIGGPIAIALSFIGGVAVALNIK